MKANLFRRGLQSRVRSLTRSALCTALAAATMIGCGDTEEPTEPTVSTIFVGEIASAEAAIAVVADVGTASSEAAIYLCDGVDTSVWYFGTLTGNVIDAQSDTGALATAMVAGDRVTGTVQLPGQPPVEFSASLASGVAGMYLVEQSAILAEGFSVNGATINADLTAGTDGSTVSGTVTTTNGDPIPLAGTLRFFGEGDTATWIMQADGNVKGRAKVQCEGCFGGGNCSIWQKIKSLATGVH